MTSPLVVAVATVCSMLLSVTGVRASQCESPSDADVKRLLEPMDVRQLDAAAPTERDHPALVALYRSRRYSLVQTGAEARRYFRSLPRSEDELWCVYSLTNPDIGNHEFIGEAVYEMFDRAAHIARMLGTGHDRVLHLALWSDGELANSAWEAVDWLLANDPVLTAAAIKRLSRHDQKRMCCGSVANTLTTRQIVARCRPCT